MRQGGKRFRLSLVVPSSSSIHNGYTFYFLIISTISVQDRGLVLIAEQKSGSAKTLLEPVEETEGNVGDYVEATNTIVIKEIKTTH